MSTKPPRLQVTKTYRLFLRHDSQNRAIDLAQHKKLYESMKLYGFLPDFPISVRRNAEGGLVVKDGQHRLAFAEELGLPVYWLEGDIDYDVATVNQTTKTWQVMHYAQKFSAQGFKDYGEAIDFSRNYSAPLTNSLSMLAGTVSFNNIKNEFYNGTYKIKDRKYAAAVAEIYVPFTKLSAKVRKNAFLEACMAVCRVPEFDASRLLGNSERCREKLGQYSSRDAYLTMLEDVYNFGKHRMFGLRVAAMMAMKDRNAAGKNPKKKTVAAA